MTDRKKSLLEERLDESKACLATLIAERDRALNYKYYDLLSDFAKNLGNLEMELRDSRVKFMEMTFKVNRIKEMKKSNSVNIFKLNEEADDRMNDYQLRNKFKRKEIEESYKKRPKTLLNTEKDRIHQYYESLVRMIHPEVHPDQSQDLDALWKEAKKSYEEMDFDKLEGIFLQVACTQDETGSNNPASSDDLQACVNDVESRCKSLKKYILSLYRLHPYNKEEILSSESKLRDRRLELEDRIAKTNIRIQGLEKEMLDLLIE